VNSHPATEQARNDRVRHYLGGELLGREPLPGLFVSGFQSTVCNGKYWKQTGEPTAIFVVWDDWGGWFDHVNPWIARRKGGTGGYSDCDPSLGQWGCGYTDGFRVPFLVVFAVHEGGLRLRCLRYHGISKLPERDSSLHSRLWQHPRVHRVEFRDAEARATKLRGLQRSCLAE
jgi:phosphoesterase family protein